jgi:FimV-like protein
LAAGALARILFDRGDLSDATVTWARWAARFNEVAPMQASLLLAEIRLARDEPTEAVAVLSNAIESATDASPWPFYLLGRAYADMGNRERAVESLQQALGRGDFSAAEEARFLLGRLQEGSDQ